MKPVENVAAAYDSALLLREFKGMSSLIVRAVIDGKIVPSTFPCEVH
jgi:hypothetical protein